jgi:hypothetical protein
MHMISKIVHVHWLSIHAFTGACVRVQVTVQFSQHLDLSVGPIILPNNIIITNAGGEQVQQYNASVTVCVCARVRACVRVCVCPHTCMCARLRKRACYDKGALY